MVKLFTKILCPIDFDDNSLAALDYARALSEESDAVLYVLHVVFTPLASLEFPLEPYPPVSEEPGKLELQKLALKHLRGAVRCELITRSGKPAETIDQTAEDFDVDLIGMATHGRTGLAHLFVGSVAEHVVRTSKRPVLTIRPRVA